jgi:hypothetical protein
MKMMDPMMQLLASQQLKYNQLKYNQSKKNKTEVKNDNICAYPSCTNKVNNKTTYKKDQLKGVRNPQYCCSFCAKQHKLFKRDMNLKRQKLISRKTKKSRRLRRKRA